jgi:hypothetical protein
MRNLPFVRPSVFFVFGAETFLSTGQAQGRKMASTGVGVGGCRSSGWDGDGLVENAVLGDGGHNLVFERLGWSAGVAAGWIRRWYVRWLSEERFWAGYPSKNSDGEGIRLSEGAVRASRMRVGTRRDSRI